MCGTEQALAVKSPLSSTVVEENGATTRNMSSDVVINLDHGDPTIFESYWQKIGEKCDFVMSGHQSLSYFANMKNFCWFLEPKLEQEIKRIHRLVGNVAADDCHVIVGTGSSQLVQAALYALSTAGDCTHRPVNVVAAAPYYSGYPEVSDFLKSGFYKWAGDACNFDKDDSYIELVTSPNNPNGVIRAPVVNRTGGKVIYDLAYYWPHYTPITSPVDHDIMLFTASKCTGHAGSRIGWALVKDKDVAKKICKFIEVNTIGVSKESQLRTAKILGVVSDSLSKIGSLDNFFLHCGQLIAQRWEKLRAIVKDSEIFTLQKYPAQYSHFTGEFTKAHPAFAWLTCKERIKDCEKLFKGHKILARNGRRFGVDPKHARISIVGKEEEFNLFLKRLVALQESVNKN